MSETATVAEIAHKISKDIFSCFLWKFHPKIDDNFPCTNTNHLGDGGKAKSTHPGDVVFYYDDPYLGRKIFLHTDLKSYGAKSITSTKVRTALKSLCMTIDCARVSSEWRTKYSVDESESYDVRGLLFIYNHDNLYANSFY